MRQLARTVGLFSILMLSACTHHVVINFPTVQAAPAETHSEWVNGFLWHLIGGETNLTAACGLRGVVRVDTKSSFGNAILAFLTIGIYTPMHVKVTCAAPPAYPR